MHWVLWLIAALLFFAIALLVIARRTQKQRLLYEEVVKLRMRVGLKGEKEQDLNDFMHSKKNRFIVRYLHDKFKQAGMSDSKLIVRFWVVQAFVILFSIVVFLTQLDRLTHQQILIVAVLPALPVLYLTYRVYLRQKQMRESFPKMLDTLVRSLQAGYGIDGALNAVVEDMEGPLSEELAEVSQQLVLGISMRQILRDFQSRVDMPEAQYFVITLIIQRETGGQLSTILAELSKTMRRREQFQQKLQTLTAESRMTAWFIGGAPVAYILYRYLFNYESMQFFLEDPTGVNMFIFSIGMIAIGGLILKSMLSLKF